jgi:hypothetical protein
MGECMVKFMVFLGYWAVLLTISGSIDFGLECHKENYFIENVCFVVDAQVVQETCQRDVRTHSDVYTVSSRNMTLTASEKSDIICSCYQPLWTVEYNNNVVVEYSIQKRAQILGSHSATYDGAAKELDKHHVSATD